MGFLKFAKFILLFFRINLLTNVLFCTIANIRDFLLYNFRATLLAMATRVALWLLCNHAAAESRSDLSSNDEFWYTSLCMEMLHSSFSEVTETSHRQLSLLKLRLGQLSADVPITMALFAHVSFFLSSTCTMYRLIAQITRPFLDISRPCFPVSNPICEYIELT